MKKTLIFLALFLAALALNAAAIREDFRRADEKARMSYAFGMLVGSDVVSLSMEFDYEAFTEGFRAVMEGIQPQISEMEAMELVETAFYEAMERANRESRQREMEFLIANSMRDEVHVTASGLQYEIIVETEGEKPAYDSTVMVNYAGYLTDGTLFDMSDEGGMYIPLAYVIPGWTEGLMLMSVGSEYILYIPSELAYGANGIQGVIPPYSTVVFSVQLLDITNDEDWYWYDEY